MSSVDELNMDETDVVNEADLYTEFVLTGVKSGKTRIYANRPFVKGVCKVLKTDEEKVTRILSRYYAAYPMDQCEKVDGVWQKKEKKKKSKTPKSEDGNSFEFMSMDELKSMAAEKQLVHKGNISKVELITLLTAN